MVQFVLLLLLDVCPQCVMSFPPVQRILLEIVVPVNVAAQIIVFSRRTLGDRL